MGFPGGASGKESTYQCRRHKRRVRSDETGSWDLSPEQMTRTPITKTHVSEQMPKAVPGQMCSSRGKVRTRQTQSRCHCPVTSPGHLVPIFGDKHLEATLKAAFSRKLSGCLPPIPGQNNNRELVQVFQTLRLLSHLTFTKITDEDTSTEKLSNLP